MTKQQNELLFITGAPKSGLTLLKNCLIKLSFNDLNSAKVVEDEINEMLNLHEASLKELGYNTYSDIDLPLNWEKSKAAIRASKKFESLLANISDAQKPIIIASPYAIKFLPAWQKAINKLNLKTKYLYLLRNPWEVAHSLNKSMGIDLDSAYRKWLRSYGSINDINDEKRCVLVNYDSLFTDLYSFFNYIRIGLDINYFISIDQVYNELEMLIDPNLRSFDVKNAPHEELMLYSPFLRLYGQKLEKEKKNSLDIFVKAGLISSAEEDEIVETLIDKSSDMVNEDVFTLLVELAKYYQMKKDYLRAMHYCKQASKVANSFTQIQTIAKYYSELGQDETALGLYIESLFQSNSNGSLFNKKMASLYQNQKGKKSSINEHGHQLLIDYIKQNSEYIKTEISHKPTLVEIGTTREDVPGQGSTEKFANFCKQNGLHFITVDMDPLNIKLALATLQSISSDFEAVCQKGEDFLRDYDGPFDFVFLDAYDFDHGKHSEGRQERYEKYLGSKINDEDCHKMHLECAETIVKKLSVNGAVCLDDTWFENGKWRGKGTTALPYLLNNGFNIVLSANKAVLLVRNSTDSGLYLMRHLERCTHNG